MSITFANAKNGCQGSGSSTSTPANTLSLFTSESTKGYNFYKNKSASNGNWEVAVFGRAHNYSSSAETYSYTIYVFGRKLNSATSHGDFDVTFYYRDKSYSVTNSRYLQSSTGKVRLIASHTFDGLNCEPYTSTTIGAKVVGPSGTEASGTITATDTADFSGGASWSVYVQSDSSIKLEGTGLTTNRGFRHAWVWQWKRTSASSYTTEATTNCVADNTTTSLSYTFTGLVRNTSYDVRARFYLRNYDPTDSTYNDPVPISSRTIVRTATTDKSDLSGSVSLSGNRYVGGTLTANVTNTDNATLAYQWCYNTTNSGSGTVISGATSSTYTVTSDYVGKYIYCKVTFSKTDYNNLVIRKYTSDVVYKRTPAISVSISGNCVYDQTLTANVTCDSTGTKTYQWGARVSPQASPTDISGATKSTYKIGSGLVGKYIGCNVSIAETDTYAATSAVGWLTSSTVSKATNPAKFSNSLSGSVTFSTNSQNKSFIGVTTPIGSVSYNISSQKNSSGVDVDYFSIPTGTDNSITIAAGTPAGTYTLDIGINVSGNEDVNAVTGGVYYTLTVNKASGSGSVAMNGWTYGGTVPNPTPSSSTNGTSNVSYTWYDSDKTQLSAKPTSSSNAGIYYVKASFPATTNYNAYTTDYVGFTVLPSISVSLSQDYLKGDYGVASGTISYSLGGGVGSCTNITLTSNKVKIFDNAIIAVSASIHPKKIINTTISYSISYKDYANTTKTMEGSRTISFPYDKAFDYTYSHINASGVKTMGATKDFVNDGTDPSKQFYLTATEWNDMNKFLYSAAFRKNGWNSTGLTAPNVNNTSNSQLTAAIYNSAVTLAEKITGVTYNRVTSGSRITSKHFNGFRDIINANKITFILDGTTYTVENGTTWKHFSDENGLNCASDEDGVWDANYNYRVYNSSGQSCKGGDVIVSDTYVWVV